MEKLYLSLLASLKVGGLQITSFGSLPKYQLVLRAPVLGQLWKLLENFMRLKSNVMEASWIQDTVIILR